MRKLLKQFCVVLVFVGASFTNTFAGTIITEPTQSISSIPKNIEEMAYAVEMYVRFGKTPDPITVTFEECKGESGSTSTIQVCMTTAYESYNKLMKQVFQKVLEKNDANTAKAVQKAQKKWFAFQEAENIAQNGFPRKGTIRRLLLGDKSIIAVRQRIAELSFYLQETSG